ncbi:MAG: PEP-CTERM sorting domain-containing protein [Gammaproteobacteria bacterium]|nr:PEP-CTERM sorting domain-containing protein [Gammaproteobacteria bacterium]
MYKILSITALASGMLLLAPGAQAAPIVMDAHEISPNSHGLHMAASRAHPNARFNRDATGAHATPATPMRRDHPLTTQAAPQTAPQVTPHAVPAPGALVLLSAGMLGAIVVRRRRRNR